MLERRRRTRSRLALGGLALLCLALAGCGQTVREEFFLSRGIVHAPTPGDGSVVVGGWGSGGEALAGR